MSNVGIPIKLLYEAEGMKVTVEVRLYKYIQPLLFGCLCIDFKLTTCITRRQAIYFAYAIYWYSIFLTAFQLSTNINLPPCANHK